MNDDMFTAISEFVTVGDDEVYVIESDWLKTEGGKQDPDLKYITIFFIRSLKANPAIRATITTEIRATITAGMWNNETLRQAYIKALVTDYLEGKPR